MVIIKKAKRKNLVSITSLGILSSIAGITGTNSSAHAETLTAANTITTANSYDDDGKSNTETTDTNSNDNSKESTLTFNTVADNNASIGTNADTTVNAASPDSIATDQTADTEKNADSVTEDNSTDYANTETTANSVNTLLTSSLLQSNTTTTTANDSYIPVKSYGVDVSGYQDTDLTKYSQAGAKYTIVKLSEGTWYTNPNAQGQVNSADKLGMATYAYHFANFSDSTAEAEKEADFAIQQAQKVGIKPGTYFAIDWETEGNANVVDGNTEQNTSAILAFMRKVSAAGYKPLVYTGAYNFQNHLNVSEIIKQFPNSLWVASYKTTGEIDEPDFNYFPSMEGVAIWQFTSNWRGLHVDANVNVLPLSSNASTTDDKDKAISVNYQVVDDDNNGAVVASGTFSGKSNTSLSNRSIIDTNAPDVLNKYVLSSPDGNTLLNNDTGTITIHVNHKTETVTETREATFDITEDSSTPGNVGPASGVSKKYTFSRTGTKDLVTGQTTWGEWPSPKTLKYDKYTFTVTADSPNTKITITSKGMLINTDTAPHKVTNTVNFVDVAGKTVKTTTVSADDQNQTIDISGLIPEGYQLANSASNSLISGDNGSFFNVAIVKNNADSNNTDNGSDPSPSDPGKSDSETDTTPTNPSDSHNGSDDSNTDNNKNDSDSGKADSSVTNVVEFVDENSNIVGSTTIKADAAGKSFTLDGNSIPTGYQLAEGASLTLTTKDNGATIQIKVVKTDTNDSGNSNGSGSNSSSDNGNTDNNGQSNTNPITPGASDNNNGAIDSGSGSSNSDSNTDNTNNDKNDNSSSNGSDTGDSSNSGSDGSTTTPSVPDSSDNSNSNSDNGTTDNTDNANNSNSENNVNISDNTDSIDNANNVNNDTGKNSGSQTGTSDNAQAMINLDNDDVLTQEPVSTGIPSTDTSFGTQNGSDLISASSGDVNSTLATTLPQTGNSVQDTKVLKATGAVILLSEAVLSLGFAITKKKPDNQ